MPDLTLNSSGSARLTSLKLNGARWLPQFPLTFNGLKASGEVDIRLTWKGSYNSPCAKPGAKVARPLVRAHIAATSTVTADHTAASAQHRLSNELTRARRAHPLESGAVYSAPRYTARRMARLHLTAEDRFPEVYVLLDSFAEPEQEEWIRIAIPGRPNGRTGWVPREDLGVIQHSRWRLVVDLAARRMDVYSNGRPRRTLPVGVGKPSTPTPPGHFWLRERYALPNPANPYYPCALGTPVDVVAGARR